MIREFQWIALDNFRRKLFLKYEIKRVVLKSIIHNNNIPFLYRYYALYNRNKITRHATLVRQRNRCVQSGRIWAVLKRTQYSRFVIRTEAYAGNLPACRRASW